MRCSQRARAGVETLNRKYAVRPSTISFSSSIARAVGIAGEGLWMGYERKRGKLDGVQCPAPRRLRANAFRRSSARPQSCRRSSMSSRSTPTRNCRAMPPAQLVGTMAHPLNRPVFDPARGIVTEGYSILQPRVGVSLPSAGRSWFVRLFAGDAGIDPYTRAVSDVYQEFSRKVVHRQRHLRCGCVRARAGGTFSGEHDAEPRLAGISPCALGAGQRRGVLRGISFPLQRGHRPAAPLDSGRLADHAVAAAAGSRAGRPTHRQSALRVCRSGKFSTIFDAAWSRSRCCSCCSAAGCSLPELGGLGRCSSSRSSRVPGLLVGAGRAVSQAGANCRGRCICAAIGELVRTPTRPGFAHSGVPAVRCLHQPGRHRADVVAPARDAQTAPGMANVAAMPSRRARSDLAGFYATMWIAPAVALATGFSWSLMQPAQLAAGPADSWTVARRALDCLVDQPANRAAGAGFDGRSNWPFSADTARKTWHFFETFVTAQENWLPPDNFQEDPVPGDGLAHFADEHGTGAARQPGRPRFWLSVVRPIDRAHGRHHRHDAAARTASRPFLQLV